MSTLQFATVLILVAAFLHAVTNALIKISVDPLLTRGFMSTLSAVIALPFLWFVPPLTPEAWTLLAPSVAVHLFYPFLLAASYRHQALSVALPVARGVSPLVLLTLVALLDPGGVPARQVLAVLVIVCGLLILARPVDAVRTGQSRGLGYAVATGVVVAIYTYLDAHGVRAASTSVSYISWLIVIDGSVATLVIGTLKRRELVTFVRTYWKPATAATLLGVINFGMALYALGLGNIVEIGTLRETTIIFAAFLGARMLKEGHATRRMVAAAIVLAGIALMQALR